MRRLFGLALAGAVLATAAPAFAGDAKDTLDQKTHETKKTVRHAKPGDPTASDRKEDAKDTAGATAAKTKKKLRHAGRTVKHQTKRASDKTGDAIHDATR